MHSALAERKGLALLGKILGPTVTHASSVLLVQIGLIGDRLAIVRHQGHPLQAGFVKQLADLLGEWCSPFTSRERLDLE